MVVAGRKVPDMPEKSGLQWVDNYGCDKMYIPGVGWLTVQPSLTDRSVIEVTVFGQRLGRTFTEVGDAKKAALRVALVRVQKAVLALREVAPPPEATSMPTVIHPTCPKCKGEKKVFDGPDPTGWITCPECNGEGTVAR
jgi:hypothetical protein